MSDVLSRAFPSWLRGSASTVLAELPTAANEPAGRFAVRVGSEDVEIPQRIYNPEPATSVSESWPSTERDVFACLYTRHHNGHVRQRHLRSVIGSSHPWVVPFVVQLIGEYVVEIVLEIQAGLTDLKVANSPQRAQYGTFAAINRAFIDLTAQRVASYWDCYYRSRYPRRESYPGFALVAALRDAASERGRTLP